MSLLCQKEGEVLVNYGGRFDAKGNEFNFQYFNSDEIDPKDSRYSG